MGRGKIVCKKEMRRRRREEREGERVYIGKI
jgi:hypothetical protein